MSAFVEPNLFEKKKLTKNDYYPNKESITISFSLVQIFDTFVIKDFESVVKTNCSLKLN